MYEVYLKTKQFILDFAIKEVSKLTRKKVEAKDNFILVKFRDENEFFDFAVDVLFYSRCIENMYLKIDEDLKQLNSVNNEFTFEIDSKTGSKQIEITLGDKFLKSNTNLKVELKKPDLSFKVFKIDKKDIILLDLTNFALTKRDYKLHLNSTSLNTLVPIYAFYKLGIDKKTEFKMIDPFSNLGDIIIEASIFSPRKPLNINRRYEIPLAKIFPHIPKIPKEGKSGNRFVSIVQNNKIFKEQKENINFIKSKIKLSQYTPDWLDVKFKREEFDYVITQILPDAQKDMLEEFFYQAEFISTKAICTICKKEVPSHIPKKFKLKQDASDKIMIGEQQYFIQIFV